MVETSQDDPARRCGPDRSCITCGDLAIALRVLAIDEDRCLALCEDDSGRRESVEIALVLPVSHGDELLVHAGTAIRHLGRLPQVAGAEG